MFGSGQHSTARHRATAEDSARLNGSPTARSEKHHAAPSRTPIWATALVFGVLLLAVFGAWVLFGRDTGSSQPGPAAGTPTGTPTTSTSPTRSAAAGPGLRTAVRLRPDGSVRTTERITFRRPRSSLVLSIPRRPGAAAQFAPSVTNVGVRANGNGQRRNDTLSTGEATTFQLRSPATRVVVRYSVDNAVARNHAYAPDRTLALVTPVKVAQLAGIRSNVKVVSPHVLNIGCVSPRGVLATCGSRTAHGWQVRARAGRPVPDVIAHVHLPG